MSVYELSVQEFVRSVHINKDAAALWLLGAGASISSGVPSAGECIWHWKRSIFLSAHPGMSDLFSELSLPSTRSRIQQWLDAQKTYPPANAPDEYGIYAQRCYPIAADRQTYFRQLISGKQPHVGYLLLGLVAEAGMVDSVWTTNFDGLVSRAVVKATRLAPIEIGLDSRNRLREPRTGEIQVVALHGDYRYDDLKNLPDEVAAQEALFVEELMKRLLDRDLVVVGYSGRDDSVMTTLGSAFGRPGKGRLYWCHAGSQEPAPAVVKLIKSARACGRDAFLVPVQSFDDLMYRLAAACLTGDGLAKANTLLATAQPRIDVPPPFELPAGPPAAVSKSNSFPITLPAEILEADVSGFDSKGAWTRLREDVGDRPIAAGLFRGRVLALSTQSELERTFGNRIRGSVVRTPIQRSELDRHDGIVVSILISALARALAYKPGLNVDRERIWRSEARTTRTVNGTRVVIHDAILLSLRLIQGNSFLIVKPTVHARLEDGHLPPKSIAMEAKRGETASWTNDSFNDRFKVWHKLLFSEPVTEVEYPPASGSGFRFSVGNKPPFAALTGSPALPSTIVQTVNKHLRFQGTIRPDARLLFRARRNDGYVKDEHPIRGIVENRPYDFDLSSKGLEGPVRISVVCPQSEAHRAANFLAKLTSRAAPDTKGDYLIEFPGFQNAFGTDFVVAAPGSSGFVDCPEPSRTLSAEKAYGRLRMQLLDSVKQAAYANPGAIVVIFKPKRWDDLENSLENREPNLHDAVKALCVQLGACTQFIREQTLNKKYSCEIMWWLALSFYSKAMRIPWLLDGLDDNTAFVGMGFAIDRTATSGQHILVGCSHLYNARGYGLRYQLSRLESSVVRRGNPYLSREDARRLAQNARQLFYTSMQKFPQRVVLHKRTEFTRDERDGLREGFDGVKSLEMLTIQEDPQLRFIASTYRQGQLEVDKFFPLPRGAAIALGPYDALVWLHGSAASVQQGSRRYFKGRKGVPVPLRIHRYAGSSDLPTLVDEVLGLSKMSWNSFDLYSNLPATIESSNEIARIGRLLDRFGPLSYDYRLFI
jgi:hypothetical protein